MNPIHSNKDHTRVPDFLSSTQPIVVANTAEKSQIKPFANDASNKNRRQTVVKLINYLKTV